jgi:hypothetical protein
MFYVYLLIWFNLFFWGIRAGARRLVERDLDKDFPRGVPFPTWVTLLFVAAALALAGLLAAALGIE